MKKTMLMAAAILGFSQAASAATFTYENNSAAAGAQTIDGITVSFSAPKSGQDVAYVARSGILEPESGVGIDSGGFLSSNAIGNNETLRVNFSSLVTVDAVRLGQWQISESVTFTTNKGNSLTWNTESAAFSSYETVGTTALGNMLYLDITGNTGTTFATLNRLSNVSAVPLPAAAWLFGSALLGLVTVARRKTARL